MKMKKFLAALLTMSMALSAVPMTAWAAEGDVGESTTFRVQQEVEPATTIATPVEFSITPPVSQNNKTEIQMLAEGDPVQETTYVAQIGETKYETLDDAVKNASPEAEIKLLKSVSAPWVSINKSITLDLGGNTMTCTSKTYTISVSKGGIDVTIKNGTIESSSSTAVNAGWANSIKLSDLVVNASGSIAVQCSASTEINNCSITNTSEGKKALNISSIDANETVTVTNTQITSQSGGVAVFTNSNNAGTITLGAGNRITGCVTVEGKSTNTPYKLNITGGEFSTSGDKAQFNNSTNDKEELLKRLNLTGGFFKDTSVSSFLSSSCILIENTGANKDDYPYTTQSVPEGTVACVGSEYYNTLSAAITAADGATVTLVKDVETDSLSGTINGSGNTITYTGTLQSLMESGATITNAKFVCNDATINQINFEDGKLIGGQVVSGDVGEYLAQGYLVDFVNKLILPESKFEASIGKVGFNLLYSAEYVASQYNDLDNVIVMLKDVQDTITTSSENAAYTLDLNGHVLSSQGSYAFGFVPIGNDVPNNANVKIIDSSAAKTGKIVGKTFGVVTNGTLTGAKLTLDGITVESTEGYGVYFPSDGSLTVTNCKISGKTGIEIRDGQVSINGSTITSTADTFSENANNNGPTIIGAAVAVSQYGADREINLTVSNSILTGQKALYEKYFQSGSINNIQMAVNSGKFNGVVYSQNCKKFISGGHFTSDPSAYKANSLYVVESTEKPEYLFMVTAEKPQEVPVIVTETVEANVGGTIKDEDKEAVEAVIGKAEASGISNAMKEENKGDILAEAGVNFSNRDPENPPLVEVEVNVKVEATDVKWSSEEQEASINFKLEPFAKVKVDGITVQENGQDKEVAVSNDYLNGEPITVKLPVPAGIPLDSIKEVKHTCKDGTVEYFYAEGTGAEKTFKIEDGMVVIQITKFSEILLSATFTAEAKADGVGYPTLQEAVDAVQEGGSIEVLQDGLSARVQGRKTFEAKMADGVEGSFTLTAASHYKLYQNGDTYTVKRKPSSDDSSSSGGGGSTSTKPVEKPEEKPADNEQTTTPVDPATIPAAEKIVLTVNKVEANVYGKSVVNDVAPIIRGERTMLPIRFVAEALGATVAWDGTQQKVTITKGEDVIDIYINSAVAFVNGNPVDLDSPAFIENSRTYLPLRFVAENLGADVHWNAETKEVTVVPNK